jgi:hypothetical protein
LDERKNAGKGWTELLKPNIPKIVVTLIVPAIVGLLVTQRIENTVDFYGYLLTPRLALWTGEGIVYVFNRWLFLWIPFYLFACAFSLVVTRARTPRQPDSELERDEGGA